MLATLLTSARRLAMLAVGTLFLVGVVLTTTSWLTLWLVIFAAGFLLLATSIVTGRLWKSSLLAIVAIIALFAADFITTELTDRLLEDVSWRGAAAIALLAIASVSGGRAVFLALRVSPEKLRAWLAALRRTYWRSLLSLKGIAIFVLFSSGAAVTGYFLLKELKKNGSESVTVKTIVSGPDTNLIIALLTATLVALLFALWGRDLVRRLQKVGTGGIEFGTPQESDSSLRVLLSDEDRSNVTHVSPAEALWNSERKLSQYLHLQHSGIDIHKLEGADLRSYRRLSLSLGRVSLRREQYRKALDILEPLDYLRDATFDELFSLAAAHYSLATSPKEPAGAVDENNEDLMSHYRETKHLLERAITSPNRQAKAHWMLAYAYDELGEYIRAVEQNQIAIRMDPVKFSTVGWWNTAVSRLKNNEPKLAIEALEQIKSDDDQWQEIWDDPELADLRNHPEHGDYFEELYRKSFWERDWGWLYANRS